MKQIQKFLSEEDAQGAMDRFVALMKQQPAKTGELAKAMTGMLIGHYDQFHARPVEDFHEIVPMSLPEPIARAMAKFLQPMIDRTKHWRVDLEGVTRERLAREARAAVTLNDHKTAATRGVALIKRGDSPAENERLARYLIEALAALYRDRDRSQKVIAIVAGSRSLPPMELDLRQAFIKATETGITGGMEENNKQWTANLDTSITSIREFCPDRREMGEPSAEDMRKFTIEMMSILRVGLDRRNRDDFIDALNILKDFCPCDPSRLPTHAGVEPRVFLELGGKAKLTAVRSLAKIGENAILRKQLIELISSSDSEGRTELFGAVMGGLRQEAFYPYLKTQFKKAKGPRQEEILADALGRIGNPDAVDLILDNLARSMKKHLDPAHGRRAKMLLTALGRIGRAKGLDPDKRNKIVGRVIKCVGDVDTWIAQDAAAKMFTIHIKQLDPKWRLWAARANMKAMFSLDSGQNLQDSQRAPLGFRQPIITAVNRLGNDALPEILKEASKHAGTYNAGAYNALGEALQAIGDERAVDLLESMTRTAFLFDDSAPRDRLLTEKVMDAATEEMREIGRDDVIHTLLFTIKKIGGTKGEKIVLGYADQVQTGQLTPPGQETGSFLAKCKREGGGLGKLEAAPEATHAIEDQELNKAVSRAKGGLMTNNRKRIEALALLGRARQPETAGVILQCLKDKDSMIVQAAVTALTQFVTPPPTPKQYKRFLIGLFEDKKMLKGNGLERLLDVIARHFPKRPPYDKLYKKFISIELDPGELTHRLLGAIHLDEQTSEAGDDESEIDGSKHLNMIQIKRQYLIERKQWIAAGKHGPPPKPPAGSND